MTVDIGRHLDGGAAQIGARPGKNGSIREDHGRVGREGSRADTTGIHARANARGGTSPKRRDTREDAAGIGSVQRHAEAVAVGHGHAVGRVHVARVPDNPVGEHQIGGAYAAGRMTVDIGRHLDGGAAQIGARPGKNGSIREDHGRVGREGSRADTTGIHARANARGGTSPKRRDTREDAAGIGSVQRHAEAVAVGQGHAVGRVHVARVPDNPVGKGEVCGTHAAGRMTVDILGDSDRIGPQIGGGTAER